MDRRVFRRSLAWTLSPAALLVAAAAFGQCANPVAGPDVIVGDIPDVEHYTTAGPVNGKRAYAFGTTSCNLGSTRLIWDDTTNVYPVISQNMYLVANGRIEQVGQAWLKHGFCALQGNVCCSCQPGGNCDALFPGCSDPYSAGLNGSQGGLGPKHEIDAAAGYIPLNWNGNGTVEPGDTAQRLYKRLQVLQTDLAPQGGVHLFASSYVQPEDSEFGNDLNSQSYRRVTVNQSTFNISLSGTTQRGRAAIYAWQDHGLGLNTPDPNVQITVVNDPSAPRHNNTGIPGIADGGHYFAGVKVTDMGGGIWHYEYAIQNMTSDRSGGKFRIPLPPDAVITNASFHDVPYHSGEPYSNTDWNVVWAPGASEISFQSTQTFAQNPNSNALRWDTLYNFRFDCNVAPVAGNATIDLFRPAVVPATDPSSLAVNTRIPNPVGGGTFNPPNDLCVNATTVANGATFFATMNATTDGPDEPGACTNTGYSNIGSDVWYRWTNGSNAGPATVSTCGSGFDTKIAVYNNACPVASNTTLACNDDSASCGANSLQSSLFFSAAANTTYLIRIGGYQQGANPPCKIAAFGVDDRRIQPFIQRAVATQEQPQRFAQVPAGQVEVTRQHGLDHVAGLADSEIPVARMHIDEAHIVVAVGRGESPGTRSGFRGIEHAHFVLLLDVGDGLDDRIPHRTLSSHCRVSSASRPSTTPGSTTSGRSDWSRNAMQRALMASARAMTSP